MKGTRKLILNRPNLGTLRLFSSILLNKEVECVVDRVEIQLLFTSDSF